MRTFEDWRKKIAVEFPLNNVPQDIIVALEDYGVKELAMKDSYKNLITILDRIFREKRMWDARRILIPESEE